MGQNQRTSSLAQITLKNNIREKYTLADFKHITIIFYNRRAHNSRVSSQESTDRTKGD